VVSDDPVVFLGEHRADAIAAVVKPIGGFLDSVLSEFSHLTHISLGGLFGSSAKALTGDYVNNGTTVVLPGAAPSLTVQAALHDGLSEHNPDIYVSLTGSATVFEPHLW
jgi:hypothetical protein